jgi:cathepsin L
MIFSLIFALSVSAFTDIEYETEFKTFLSDYQKIYEEEELLYRFGIFKKSMDDVLEHNSGNHSYTKGINQFSDLTQIEFEKIYLGFISRPVKKVSIEPVIEEPDADVDWRGKGALTPIKNQGQCGSCWAFSSTGGVEGAEFISKGSVTSLSEQTLVDCSGSYGNHGCNGGLMDNAFKYIKAKGIASESSYPYTGRDGSCKSYSSATKISSYTDVRGGTSGLATAVVKQPISVAVDARKWSSYHGGTYSCSGSPQLDHGVLLVGSYSSYWIIKNSWGPSWGLSGFMQLSKNSGDCGVTQQPSYPTI